MSRSVMRSIVVKLCANYRKIFSALTRSTCLLALDSIFIALKSQNLTDITVETCECPLSFSNQFNAFIKCFCCVSERVIEEPVFREDFNRLENCKSHHSSNSCCLHRANWWYRKIILRFEKVKKSVG